KIPSHSYSASHPFCGDGSCAGSARGYVFERPATIADIQSSCCNGRNSTINREESNRLHTSSGSLQEGSRSQPNSFSLSFDRVCLWASSFVGGPTVEAGSMLSGLDRSVFGKALSAKRGVFTSAAAHHGFSHFAAGCLWGVGREKIRNFRAEMGFVELGLGESRIDFPGRGNHPHLVALCCHPPQSKALVVLFLAGCAADWRVSVFYRALGD